MSDMADDERFPSRKKALDWLQANGHKISTGKFYGDCDKGLVPVATDGSLSAFHVLRYGLSLNKAVAPDPQAVSNAEFSQRKEKADAEMAEMKAARMRREEDALWLHADDAWASVAALVTRLRDAIRYQLYQGQAEMVLTAAGQQDRSQELFEYTDSLISAAFNEVAGQKIEIEFGAPDDAHQ